MDLISEPRLQVRPTPPAPTTRDGLDSGSIAELVADCVEVHLDVHAARPWHISGQSILVPDDASALLDGLSAYGS
jgi:hypothetical protein